MKKVFSIVMMAALLFASVPATGGNVYAAKKPARVERIELYTNSHNSIRVKWKKVKKGVSGYTIYRNGKAAKNVGKGTTSYKDTGLYPLTTYTYYVRAYTNVKTKQWYNKKTGKWQTKKPAKKNRGKSRTVKKKLYGNPSAKVALETYEDPYNSTYTYEGRTVTAKECAKKPVTFTISGTPCPVCKKGGMVATITYNKGRFSAKKEGTDYSKKCHHCDNFAVVKCKGSEENRWFAYYDNNAYEINLATGEKKDGEETYSNHTHNGEDCTANNPEAKFYCRTCKSIFGTSSN